MPHAPRPRFRPVLTLLLFLSLGLALGAKEPAMLAAVRVEGEDPALVHLIGEGFQGPPGRVILRLGGTFRIPAHVVNDAHLICLLPPAGAPVEPWLQLEVDGRTCAHRLSQAPLTLACAPGSTPHEEAGTALTPGLRRALEVAFGAPAVQGPAPLQLDPRRREVRLRGQRLEVTEREYDLLLTLARLPNHCGSKAWLSTHWPSPEHPVGVPALEAMIKILRRKTRPDPGAPSVVFTLRDPGGQGFSYGVHLEWSEAPAADVPAHPDPDGRPAPPGPFMVLDPHTCQVSFNGGAKVRLPPLSAKFLATLAAMPGKRATIKAMARALYGGVGPGEMSGTWKRAMLLRQQIELDPHHPTRLVSVNFQGKTYRGTGARGYHLNLWDASPGARNLPPADPQPLGPPCRFGPAPDQVLVGYMDVRLRPESFQLLKFLYDHPDKAASTEAILRLPLFRDANKPEWRLYQEIRRLRQALEENPQRPTRVLNDPNADGRGHGGYRLNLQ